MVDNPRARSISMSRKMRHPTLVRKLSGGLLAALLVACAVAPRADARRAKAIDFAELDEVVEAELKDGHTPGAAVAVVSGDRVVYAKGFGVTSAEDGGRAVTPETLFRMGSTTKMFTAAALVTLASEGKIRLNAPVGDFVKNLPPKIAALTAHQLLSQSSGLRDFAPAVTSDDDAALAKNIRAWTDDLFFTEPNRIRARRARPDRAHPSWASTRPDAPIRDKSFPNVAHSIIIFRRESTGTVRGRRCIPLRPAPQRSLRPAHAYTRRRMRAGPQPRLLHA